MDGRYIGVLGYSTGGQIRCVHFGYSDRRAWEMQRTKADGIVCAFERNTVSDRIASREAKQMINGGRWISGDAYNPEKYEPPVGTSHKPGKVDVFTYSKIMDKFENVEGDEKYVRERIYLGGIGRMARTGGAGSWTDSEYTLTFNTYTDDEGVDRSSPQESDFTISQWENFELSGVIVDDWEKAGE